MLQIYDDKKKRVALIENVTDLCIETTLEYGDKKLSFKYPISGSHVNDLKNEYYIRTKKDEFVLKSVADGSTMNEYIAQLNIEELQSKQFTKGFECVEKTVRDCLTTAFMETPWSIGVCDVEKKRTIRKESQCNAWEIVKDCVSTYRIEIRIDSINKVIDIFEKVGSDKGSYIMEGLNLKKLSRKKTTYDFFNVIIPLGKDNIGIDVLGKNYIENYQYSSKRITRVWKDERYTNTTSLYEDAKAKVDEASKPLEAYSAEVSDLAKQKEIYQIIDYGVGDVVTLISNSSKIKTKQRIVKLKEYPKTPSKNSVELSTAKKTFAEIQKQQQDMLKQEAINIANGSTEVKLNDYYSKKETDSKITANGNDILLSVSKTYQTQKQVQSSIDGSLEKYSTTEQMNGAISTSAENIQLEVSKIYQTSQQVQNAIGENLEDYSTTDEMNAAIKLKADAINLSVSQKVGYDEIIASINISKEKVKIKADLIEMSGLVKFTDLQGSGSTQINADNLTSGTIRGLRFEAGEIDVETDVYLGRKIYLGRNLSGDKGIYFSDNSAIYLSDSNLCNITSAFLVYPIHPLGTGDIPYMRFISDAGDDYFTNGLAEMSFTFGGAASDLFMGSFMASMDGEIQVNCKQFISNKGVVVTSDIAYKKNFEEIEVDWIKELNIVKYDLIDGTSENDIGIRANDYESKEYSKYFLTKDRKGKYAVDYKNIANALVKYVQQLDDKVEKLEKEIEEMKKGGGAV